MGAQSLLKVHSHNLPLVFRITMQLSTIMWGFLWCSLSIIPFGPCLNGDPLASFFWIILGNRLTWNACPGWGCKLPLLTNHSSPLLSLSCRLLSYIWRHACSDTSHSVASYSPSKQHSFMSAISLVEKHAQEPPNCWETTTATLTILLPPPPIQ